MPLPGEERRSGAAAQRRRGGRAASRPDCSDGLGERPAYPRPPCAAAPLRRCAASLFLVLLAACSSGKRISAENDRLRLRVIELERQAAVLTAENAELKLRSSGAAAGDSVDPEVRDATPQVTSISIDRLSHARDQDGDGRADVLTVYVAPADGRGRFVQLVGSLSAHAAYLPEQSDAVTIGRLTLGPAEVRDAYRASFMGTHYTLDLPLTLGDGPGADECTVRVVYRDGYTGQEQVAERAVKLKPAT